MASLGKDLVTTAQARESPEAIDLLALDDASGVQWHPELMPEDPLEGNRFNVFVKPAGGQQLHPAATTAYTAIPAAQAVRDADHAGQSAVAT